MRLIRNLVIEPISEYKYLLINTLNGLIDEIDKKSYDTITVWSLEENIVPSNEYETNLFNDLNNRGYIVSSINEEEEIKSQICEKLRQTTEKVKNMKENITLVLTYDCNFRCPYCFEADNSPLPNVMSEDMVDTALAMIGDQLKKIHLFGGEPLLPKTRNIIEYIVSQKKNLTYQITSNGYYLLEYIDILKSIKISCITVTLDGPSQIHDTRRYLPNGKPTYEKILNGIKTCLENKINIKIRMNLDLNNIDNCFELKKCLLSQLPNAKEHLSFEMTPILQLKSGERTEILKKLIAQDAEKSELELIMSNHMFASLSNPLIKYLLYKERMKPLYNYCYAHNNYIVFDPVGYMYPCITAVGKKQYSVGTYYPSVEYKKNSIYERNIETISECRKCNYAFLCGGGCPLGLPDSSNIFKPNCSRTLHDMKVIVPYIYEKKYIQNK